MIIRAINFCKIEARAFNKSEILWFFPIIIRKVQSKLQNIWKVNI